MEPKLDQKPKGWESAEKLMKTNMYAYNIVARLRSTVSKKNKKVTTYCKIILEAFGTMGGV